MSIFRIRKPDRVFIERLRVPGYEIAGFLLLRYPLFEMPSKKVDRPVRDIRIRRFPARRSYDIACDRDMRDA